MEVLLPIVVLAVLLLVVLLWSPPSSPRARVRVDTGTRLGRGVNAEPATATAEGEIFTLPFVRRRMDVVADELERLERDPAVFARAFHTIAAKSAYDALMADAARLADVPSLDLDPDLDVDFDVDRRRAATDTYSREVLDR